MSEPASQPCEPTLVIVISAKWILFSPVLSVIAAKRSLPGGVSIKSVAVGVVHTCIISTDGQIFCWGYNNHGQLGLTGDYLDKHVASAVPPVSLGAGVIANAVDAGAFHTCALLASGDVQCWGRNDNGELGHGVYDNFYAV